MYYFLNDEGRKKKRIQFVLTLTYSAHIVRDSCIAMRQKAVMEASESLPRTSPYTWTRNMSGEKLNMIITVPKKIFF